MVYKKKKNAGFSGKTFQQQLGSNFHSLDDSEEQNTMLPTEPTHLYKAVCGVLPWCIITSSRDDTRALAKETRFNNIGCFSLQLQQVEWGTKNW